MEIIPILFAIIMLPIGSFVLGRNYTLKEKWKEMDAHIETLKKLESAYHEITELNKKLTLVYQKMQELYKELNRLGGVNIGRFTS